jgi:ABC-type transport system involved in multi-copper enzyme maturation permease subunit
VNIAVASPLATRELRQAARQKRGPILLGALGIFAPLLSLLMASAMSSPWTTAAEIGRFVFEAMVTLALCAVVLVGVTCAASSVASEREGHTWEALLLSGLRPSAIVRGKFLGAFAQAALYLFALAPSMALSFLVGGITVTEILVALGLVLGVAAVAVLFGLAISSFARTARGALAGALVATLVAFPLVYSLFMGLGFMVASIMGDSEGRASTWLAHAIVSAPFSARSFVFFGLDPLLVLAVPAWLIFEVTKANVSDPSDDRSTGLRRWYVCATVLLVGGGIATMLAVPIRRDLVTIGLLLLVAMHLGFSSLVFGGEPLGPSRRVAARLGGRRIRIGIAPATVLHACLGAAALTVIYAVGALLSEEHADLVGACAHYAIGFHLFVAGATGVMVVRVQRANLVRGLVVAGMLVLTVLPLIAGSVGEALTGRGGSGWKLLEAMSPLFPTMMASRYPDELSTTSAHAATIGYGLVGVLLVVCTCAMARRSRARSL